MFSNQKKKKPDIYKLKFLPKSEGCVKYNIINSYEVEMVAIFLP